MPVESQALHARAHCVQMLRITAEWFFVIQNLLNLQLGFSYENFDEILSDWAQELLFL